MKLNRQPPLLKGPVKKQMTVEVWKCNIPDHTHKRRSSAQRCLELHEKKIKGETNAKEREHRNQNIFLAAIQGKRFPELAEEWGISTTQVQNIIKKELIVLRFYCRVSQLEEADLLEDTRHPRAFLEYFRQQPTLWITRYLKAIETAASPAKVL